MRDFFIFFHFLFYDFFIPKLGRLFFLKKQIGISVLLVIALILNTNSAIAQEAKTRINIILTDVISIDQESVAAGGAISFQYETVHDYNSEMITTVPNSLIITFTKPFDLNVKANGENFENGSNFIPVNVLTIMRNPSSSMHGTSTPIILSNQDQVLVSNIGHGNRLSLDLDYIIPQERSSSPDILGKPSGTYTQTVTYTATAL